MGVIIKVVIIVQDDDLSIKNILFYNFHNHCVLIYFLKTTIYDKKIMIELILETKNVKVMIFIKIFFGWVTERSPKAVHCSILMLKFTELNSN